MLNRCAIEFFCPFAFVTRRIEYKHLRCAQNKTYYELNLSFFQFFLCLCKFNRNSKFKCILNANTQNIRITNADGQEFECNGLNSSSWIRGGGFKRKAFEDGGV